MSAEPNMTMAGDGNGTNGIPSEVTYVSNEAGDSTWTQSGGWGG